MAEQKFLIEGGFFDSISGDRQYAASEMNRPYKRIITEGIFATPLGNPSTDLQVLSGNNQMNIVVKKGEGLLGGKWFENPADIAITVSSNTAIVPRRDSIVIQMDNRQSGRVSNVVYREGTPSSNPMPPAINTVENVIEKRVANIYVAPGANYIGQDAIVDLRGSSECPWITSLIKQVDTSTLFEQFSTAYWGFYNNSKDEWDTFMQEISGDLTVNTQIITYESHYTTTANGEKTIPINIATFNPDKDVLMVRVNHLFASETTDYTIATDGSSITLTKDLMANQNVDFLVLQTVVRGDTETLLIEIQKLTAAMTKLNQDSSWVDFTLESGATAFDDTTKPGVRRFGNQVFIRGAVKGLNTINVPICTLPENMRPAMNKQYPVTAFADGTIAANCVVEITTAGIVKLVAKSGTIPATAMLPISTEFIVG